MGVNKALFAPLLDEGLQLSLVTKAELAKQLIGAGELAQLPGRERGKKICHLSIDLEPEHSHRPIFGQQALSQQQIG